MAVTARDDGEAQPTRDVGMVLDFAAHSHARAILVLVLVALLNFLPGFFTVPPIDRDEPMFAQASKQMLETGDYIDIRFQDNARYQKPVGIYWLQAGAAAAVRALHLSAGLTSIAAYRIPSLCGGVAAVLLTYWTALAFISRRGALIAGLMMACSLLLGLESRLAVTDAVLLATVLGAMGSLARLYLPEQRSHLDAWAQWALPGIFWTALAAGILIKGPLILILAGLTIVALVAVDRDAAWLKGLRPLPGAIWMAALVLPWLIAITTRSHNAFLNDSVGGDFLPKLYSSAQQHGAPPGVYLLEFWLMFFPGSMLALLAAPAVWAARREPGAKFLLAWLVPAWILLELVITKLPHYVQPLYPAIAILIAGIIEARMLSRNRWLALAVAWWFIIPALGGTFGIACLILLAHQFGFLAWIFAGGAAIVGLVAWRLYAVDGPEVSLLRGMAAALLLAQSLFGAVLPALDYVFPSSMMLHVMAASACPQPYAAAAVGYREPSLVFLAGTATRMTDAAKAAEFLSGGGCRFAFVEAHQERDFAEHAEAIGLRYAVEPRIEGFNITNGGTVTMAVFRSEAPL